MAKKLLAWTHASLYQPQQYRNIYYPRGREQKITGPEDKW
jgi:hypothetical protein